MPTGDSLPGRFGKIEYRTPKEYVDGKSDECIVPEKLTNKGGWDSRAAEPVEGRRSNEGNADQHAACRTQSRGSASIGLDRVREAARKSPTMRFTSLLHHLTPELLIDSFYALRRDAATGVDGRTWRDYEENLAENIAGLHRRVHQGTYRAKPARRVYIPKANGGQRPLGIVAVEDKIVQYGVAQIVSAIYEQDFCGFSYGFRPGRSQHQALDALSVALEGKVNWVLDADIKSFFDTIDHEWLKRFVEHRIADPRILRLIAKWLKVGIEEAGRRVPAQEGTPQGAVISPLLANIYLHYVLDLWVRKWRSKDARGEVIIVRYADDFVMGFQYQDDARRFRQLLSARLCRFGLALNDEKTRLIEFGRFARQNRDKRGAGKPETFTFLGFTHYCAQRRASGSFVVLRKSDRRRQRARLRTIKMELRKRLHHPPREVGQWLGHVVHGYLAYHAVPGNSRSIESFRTDVVRLWYRTLKRRSQRHSLCWARFAPYCDRWIPRARILHPWPSERFYAIHPK